MKFGSYSLLLALILAVVLAGCSENEARNKEENVAPRPAAFGIVAARPARGRRR